MLWNYEIACEHETEDKKWKKKICKTITKKQPTINSIKIFYFLI